MNNGRTAESWHSQLFLRGCRPASTLKMPGTSASSLCKSTSLGLNIQLKPFISDIKLEKLTVWFPGLCSAESHSDHSSCGRGRYRAKRRPTPPLHTETCLRQREQGKLNLRNRGNIEGGFTTAILQVVDGNRDRIWFPW